MRRIVVGIDGSESSLGALRWAQSVAGADDSVHAVVGWAYPVDSTGYVDGLPAPVIPLDDLGDNARRVLDDALAMVPTGDVARTSAVHMGVSVTAALLDAATGAELLVVGSRPHSKFERVIGTVATQCAQHAPCPFAAVPESAPALGDLIAVAYDGSDESRSALRWAAATAEQRGLAVRVVSIWEQIAEPGGLQPDNDAVAAHDRAIEALRAVCEEDAPALAGRTEYLPLQSSGRVSTMLLEAAEGAGALVMGSRGRGGFTGLLLGSVSQRCLEASSIPVVIVHD